MTIELSAAQEKQLSELSAARGVPVSALTGSVIDKYLSYEQEFAASVATGRESAARGNLVDHEEVVQYMRDRFEF